ncbi:hypothetical protein S40285_04723 [Stachybotrys chlorohalonatus IBT 40285]|uniref:Carbohydrate-binding domain-containing protein n=1 Tax=Stachybotrys chlorohalonatus (strain IBT 40285) TaxID=1283841 RepID=A0A084Q9U2_STAC4|nr:hypothetical protein S40285_04723 [Stachybotrys chlorohalonata IBT 40285]
MQYILILAAIAGAALAQDRPQVPKLDVAACSDNVTTIAFDKSVPDRDRFPKTQVGLCYTDTSIMMNFTASNETSFHFDPTHSTNSDIWVYEVMGAFLHRGGGDPGTYSEFQVSPNNKIYASQVYNPSKTRRAGQPFDHMLLSDPFNDNIRARTELSREKQRWVSRVEIPLALFNVDQGKAKGTAWRFNFFRTVTNRETWPHQQFGAWSVPNSANVHVTPYFGKIMFI